MRTSTYQNAGLNYRLAFINNLYLAISLETFIPSHPILSQYISSIYILNKDNTTLRYFAYPSLNISLGLFQDASITYSNKKIVVRNSTSTSIIGVGCKRYSGVLELHYKQMVNEICINFKPLGYASFCGKPMATHNVFAFSDWNQSLQWLFETVFNENKSNQQKEIEEFLLTKFVLQPDAMMLQDAIRLLEDFEALYKLDDIASMLQVHYKFLYRSFVKNIGCSPAHFRKIAQFRKSLISGLKLANTSTLTQIGYDHHYFDQSHYIKCVRELSGERPALLLKQLTLLGKEQIAWKFF